MFYPDILLGQLRYEEMLKDAEGRRKFRRAATKYPSLFERVLAALKNVWYAKRTQPTPAQAQVMRKSLTTKRALRLRLAALHWI